MPILKKTPVYKTGYYKDVSAASLVKVSVIGKLNITDTD